MPEEGMDQVLLLCETGVRKVSGREELKMSGSVYKVIELVGTSSESWEKAAANAVEVASKSLHDLRVAEIVEMDLIIEDGEVRAYRTKVKLSFKYRSED
jgi:flavin-binding protein dodecin